jgi:hypothetical protein
MKFLNSIVLLVAFCFWNLETLGQHPPCSIQMSVKGKPKMDYIASKDSLSVQSNLSVIFSSECDSLCYLSIGLWEESVTFFGQEGRRNSKQIVYLAKDGYFNLYKLAIFGTEECGLDFFLMPGYNTLKIKRNRKNPNIFEMKFYNSKKLYD